MSSLSRELAALATASALCCANALAQTPSDGGGTNPTPRSAPESGGAASTKKAVDLNFVLAAVNDEVITLRDVLIDWKLAGRRSADPDRSPMPTKEQQMEVAKDLAMDRLWLTRAKELPYYSEYATPREIDGQAKSDWGALFDDPAVSSDERALMRRKAEAILAVRLVLQSDPEFRRVSTARPDDLRRYYDAHPESHRVSTKVKLGRVLLGREIFGEKTEPLAQQIRQRAVELGSLEKAAQEIAPGSYSEQKTYEIEHETSLREDVVAFAKSANPGDLSNPVIGQASVMLWCVLAREEGREVSFEEISPTIKRAIEDLRRTNRYHSYFVLNLLPEAYYGPPTLFDDDIEPFFPGFKERHAKEAKPSK